MNVQYILLMLVQLLCEMQFFTVVRPLLQQKITKNTELLRGFGSLQSSQ